MLNSPFTASRGQVATYLLGVALFSISFLVFLNASVSFVITDLIGRKHAVGNAVGTLGFADEVVALVACPAWGMLSDKLGLRNVVVLGYAIVGLSLFVFVQAKNVYPQLLLARLFFSLGAAATSTMVTAILPTMTHRRSRRKRSDGTPDSPDAALSSHAFSASVSSDVTITPARLNPAAGDGRAHTPTKPSRSATSKVAGFVGMFTGLGALLALGAFLPLPAQLQKGGRTPDDAVRSTFYTVGSIALFVAFVNYFGLRKLAGEESKGWRRLLGLGSSESHSTRSTYRQKESSLFRLVLEAIRLGGRDVSIGLGYLGGFVARASSVAISLFIPLFINAYFIDHGLCEHDPLNDPSDVKRHCPRAYTLAAALSGASQLVALIAAPIFGWVDGKYRRFNSPLIFASACGVAGYISLGNLESPDPKAKDGNGGVFVIMVLLGLSQIGAIVCSLSLLGRGIDGGDVLNEPPYTEDRGNSRDEEAHNDHEDSNLLPSHLQRFDAPPTSRSHLKGSIAGVYSLTGGAGILLLTKLGGYLFDTLSPGAPFYLLAAFNAVLLVVAVVCAIGVEIRKVRDHISL